MRAKNRFLKVEYNKTCLLLNAKVFLMSSKLKTYKITTLDIFFMVFSVEAMENLKDVNLLRHILPCRQLKYVVYFILGFTSRIKQKHWFCIFHVFLFFLPGYQGPKEQGHQPYYCFRTDFAENTGQCSFWYESLHKFKFCFKIFKRIFLIKTNG